jgi:hypothetical protein
MTDADFLLAFEAGHLPPAEFDHRAHLRAAWCYLERQPFLEACIAMRDGLRRFAARIGKAGLYHETITVAFMSLVDERRRAHGGTGWETLVARCPELLDRRLLSRYYREDVLASPAARAGFMLCTLQAVGAPTDGPAPDAQEADDAAARLAAVAGSWPHAPEVTP